MLVHLVKTAFDCLLLSFLMSPADYYVKGEIRNRINLISKERVQTLEQNSENVMKISWKITGKLWNFEFSQIFKKHFLTSPYEYANELMSLPHNFPFILYTEMTKRSYFSDENIRLALIPLWIDAEQW